MTRPQLPGIGGKSATRLAFFILRAPESYARELSAALLDVKDKIRLCPVCLNLTEEEPCALCRDQAWTIEKKRLIRSGDFNILLPGFNPE